MGDAGGTDPRDDVDGGAIGADDNVGDVRGTDDHIQIQARPLRLHPTGSLGQHVVHGRGDEVLRHAGRRKRVTHTHARTRYSMAGFEQAWRADELTKVGRDVTLPLQPEELVRRPHRLQRHPVVEAVEHLVNGRTSPEKEGVWW